MGIFKAKGSPYFQFTFTVKGTRYRGSTGLDRRADAQEWVAHERRKKILGHEDEETLTLSQGYAKYELEHLQFKPSYRSILSKINHVLGYFGNDTGMQTIGQNDLERYVAHSRAETFRREVYSHKRKEMVPTGKPKKTKPATINRRLSTIQALFIKARKSWKIKVQEIDFDALMLREDNIVNNTLTEDAPQILWDAAPSHIRHFIMVSLCTGWRSQNVLTLNGIKQIDLANHNIHTTGKGDKLIDTPITDAFALYIKLNKLDEMEGVCAYRGRSVKSIKTAWTSLFERTRIKYIRPHDMRHTFGTWLYRYTRDQRATQEALSHSDISTSIRYTHTDHDMLREQMNKLPVRINQVLAVK